MTSDSNSYHQLWQRFRAGVSVEQVVSDLDQLTDLVQSGSISTVDAYDLRVAAFRALRDLTIDDAQQGESQILNNLLSYCFEESSDADLRVALSRMREVLKEWLNQYSEAVRIPMREKVLERALRELESTKIIGACWTIGKIGFRQIAVTEALWNAVRVHIDEAGDTALAALISLGVTSDAYDRIAAELYNRAKSRCSLTLISAMRHFADPASIDVVAKYWLRPQAIQEDSHLASLALRVIADVADHSTSPSVQNHAWRELSRLFLLNRDVFASDLHLSSDLVPRCDSDMVVSFLLRWLRMTAGDSEQEAYWRWLLNLRLAECIRPRQLLGWKYSLDSRVLTALQKDALKSIHQKSIDVTRDMAEQESAWNTLLCLGYQSLLDWYRQGVAADARLYLGQKITRLVASFRLDPLPDSVKRLITEVFDAKQNSNSSELLARLGAIHIAQSSASRESFDALLRFGLTYEGQVLLRSTDALGAVAVTLAREGDVVVIEQLVETIMGSSEDRHRLAAASALIALARAGLLPNERGSEVAAAVTEEDREQLELSELVAVLSWLPKAVIPNQVLALIEHWGYSREDRLGGQCLETLARLGYLAEQPKLLIERLGLQQSDGKWDVSLEEEGTSGTSFLVGLLYGHEPERFEPAVVSLLRTADWQAVFPLINLLQQLHGQDKNFPPATAVKQALIERAGSRSTYSYGETDLYKALAQIAPDALVDYPWNTVWQDMLPDMRAVLADALGTGAYEHPESSQKAISHLLQLMRDGRYAVRRAAYRGLARLSDQSLYASCEAWSQAPNVELRQRAAEACAWLRASKESSYDLDALYHRLVIDSEHPVRTTVRRAWTERRERLWAEEYLSRIFSANSYSNESILGLWPYGQALTQVGDDSCRESLLVELRTQPLPLHVRHWYIVIAKGIQERWRKVTQKWPEPWLPWEGAIEEGEGEVVSGHRTVEDLRYSVWQQPGASPSELSSWGGAIWPVNMLTVGWGKFTLRLRDGREGRAMVTSHTGNVVQFTGIGSYPTKDPDALELVDD